MGAFAAGLSAGFARGSQGREHKQMLSDQEFQTNLADAQQHIAGLTQKLGTIAPTSTEYADTQGQLANAIQARTALFHPAVHPNAVQELGKAVGQHLHLIHPDLPAAVVSPETTTETSGVQLPAGAPQLPATSTTTKVQGPPQTPAQLKAMAQAHMVASGLPTYQPSPLSVEEQHRAAMVNAGLAPPVTAENWKLLPGAKPYKGSDGTYYTTEVDTAGNLRPSPMPQGFTPPPATGHLKTVPMNVKGKGWSAVSFDPATGIVASVVPGMNPPRGFIPIRRSSTATDAAGVTTSTSSQSAPAYNNIVDLQVGQPMDPGATAAAQASSEAVSQQPAQATTSQAQAQAPSTLGSLRGKARAANGKQASPFGAESSGQLKQVDDSGQIPEGDRVNPMVREAANELLQGVDMSKVSLPVKDRPMAEALARQYGWNQGKFTPREITQVSEASTFLNQAVNSSALSVLDSPESRVKLAAILEPHKGFFSSSVAAITPLNNQEREFVRLYNQLVGTIGGLSQLTRGTRPTVSGTQQLMLELPNPLQSHSAEDARQRLNRLLSEINVAQQNGTFNKVGGQGSAPAQQGGGREMVFNPQTGKLE
jgi:hypothetical protein